MKKIKAWAVFPFAYTKEAGVFYPTKIQAETEWSGEAPVEVEICPIKPKRKKP